jgi:hypothetical protein
MLPKNQITRERNVGDQHFGASPKPMLDENRSGLRGHDKQQGDLLDIAASSGKPADGEIAFRTPHHREQKGPYDKNVVRGDDARQMPHIPDHDVVKKKAGEL